MGSLSEAAALSDGRASVDSKGIARASSGVSGDVNYAIDASGFNAALQHIYRESKRSAEETVRYGMILILTSCRAMTKKGKKGRKLVNDGVRQEHFNVWYQGKDYPQKVWVPSAKGVRGETANEQQRRYLLRQALIRKLAVVERVGLAKASWGWAMKKTTGTKGDALPGRGYKQDPIVVQKLPLSLTVENKLGWIDKLVPGIAQLATRKAENKMNHWLENRWQTGIDRAARRAS